MKRKGYVIQGYIGNITTRHENKQALLFFVFRDAQVADVNIALQESATN